MRLSDDGRWFDTGSRRLPVVHTEITDLDLSDPLAPFIWHDRRCRVRIETGYELSIVWGSGTYSTNHGALPFGTTSDEFVEDVATVEVAIFDRHGEWVSEEPWGWVTAVELLGVIDALGRGVVPDQGERVVRP